MAALITVALLYLGPVRGLGVVSFLVIAALTLLLPFHAYLLLVSLKPAIDSLYLLRFGFLKLTQLFSVYSIVIWATILLLRRSVRGPTTYMDVLHLLLLLPVPLILLFSPNMGGIDLALRILSGWGFYFVVRDMDLKNARWIEWAFLLSVLFPAIAGTMAVLGYLPNGFQEGAFERLKGPYHDATAFGFELIPGFLILLHRLGRRFNPLEFAFLLLLLYLLYRTYTRALWVSVFLSVALMLLRKGKGSKVAPGLIFGIIVVGLALFYPEISARFSQHGVGTDPDSFNGRMLIWKEGFHRFFSLNPLATFFGLITTGKPMGLYLHNTYLTFLIDTGLFGFAIFTLWLWGVVRFALSYRGEYAVLLRTSLIFVLVSGLTSGGILYPNFQWFFLTVLGLAMGDYRSLHFGKTTSSSKV